MNKSLLILRYYNYLLTDSEITSDIVKYHELVIKEAEDKANFRKAVIEKSIASLVWTFVVFIGSAMWFYVKTLAQTIKL